MHPLHDYVAKQLAERLKARKVVVWYDPRSEFAAFVAEVRGGPRVGAEPVPLSVAGVVARLAEYDGSMFELRAAVEQYVGKDEPETVLVYVPGCERDRRASVLMELEKAGECYEPQLKRLARNVLRQRYTDGVIDEMLAPDGVSYADLAHASSHSSAGGPPSVLKSIFHDARGNDALLATWLVADTRDADIEGKQAIAELAKLVRSQVGLELPVDVPVAKLRALTLRYVLGGEFRSDLRCAPPASLDGVPRPKTKDDEAALRELARHLRSGFADSYAAIADRVETELGLRGAKLAAGDLGAIDTFRFEERALLVHCGELIASGRFEDALAVIDEREHSFWLDRDVGRKAQWVAYRHMATLGTIATSVRASVKKTGGDADAWIEAYTRSGGWSRLDQAQRRLEVWVAKLDEHPEERPLGVVRRAYEDACHEMAAGFTDALARGGWATSDSLHQTRIFSEVVSTRPKPVAYLLVDAMRFEMGTDLATRLPERAEVSVRHAVGALPSITPIGMAALQPGASSSFSVIEQGGKVGARIDDAFLPDLNARRKLAAARVPKLVDIALDDLLRLEPSKVAKKLDGAQVVLVRSQEMDHAGEAGFTYQAWQVMDTVIDNLARAIRKLSAAGVEHMVVSADHGHLFFASDRDESMRTDAPGGATLQLHRRCWIGRGGTTPAGCVRVAASALGYASDLEFVFPVGCGVFKAGGGLSFHHGGPSLQELLIPVVTVRLPRATAVAGDRPSVAVTGLPEAVTNRIFTVTVALAGNLSLFSTPMLVRPLLMSDTKQVGGVGLVIDGELDLATGCVTLQPNKAVTLAFQLADEGVKSLKIVVQDPATDADLYRSPADIPVRLSM